MQFEDQEEVQKYNYSSGHIQQQPELRNPWRKLLGVQPAETEQQAATQTGGQEASPILTNDPWNALLHAQGIQVVDLQQVRTQYVDVPLGEFDLEQALDIMQEQPVNEK